MRSINVNSEGYNIFGDPNSGLIAPRTGDFGATGGNRGANTYLLANITFQLAGNAPVGTFTLQTTTIGGTKSAFSDQGFGDRLVPAAGYDITVIPEPATIGLAVMGGVMLLGVALRKRSNA